VGGCGGFFCPVLGGGGVSAKQPLGKGIEVSSVAVRDVWVRPLVVVTRVWRGG